MSEKLKFKNISIETVVSICADITKKFIPVQPQLRIMIDKKLKIAGVHSLMLNNFKVDELTIMFNKFDRSLNIMINFKKNECSVNCVHPEKDKVISFVLEQLDLSPGKKVKEPAPDIKSEKQILNENLSELTKNELLELATTRGIKLNTKMLKKDVIKALSNG